MASFKLQNLSKDRKICIKQAKKKDISKSSIDILGDVLYPDSFSVRVKEIRNLSNDVKEYSLEANSIENTKELPKYIGGQYITLEVPISDGMHQRAFTIIPSFKILVKRMKNDIVSAYLFDEINVGDSLVAHGPFGDFYFQALRDCDTVIGLCFEREVIPFLSIAEDIFKGKKDRHLILLYEARSSENFFYRDKLEEMQGKYSSFKVFYFLEDITEEDLKKYQDLECSYFVSGDIAFYERMNIFLKDMDIQNKYIRHNRYACFAPETLESVFKLTVLTEGKDIVISCQGNETLMTAMEKNGISSPRRCGVGVCGFCLSKLVSGKVFTLKDYVLKADQKYDYIHPCATYPLSDIVIRLPK